ncbi:MAG: prohibitin family protein [Campylobacteraceae bacterium]|nr:prohibitin family protein [Campylobacteraceae bacterium]
MPADLNDYFNKSNNNNSNQGSNFEAPQFLKNGGGKFMGILYFIVIIAVIFYLARPFVIVNSGQMGIKATAGKFDPKPLDAGIHFFIPVIQNVILVDTKVRIVNYSSNEDSKDALIQGAGIIRKNSISVLDSRGLTVLIDLTVQYKLNPDNASITVAQWGLAWEDKIINPVVREVVRSVVGNYPAEELPTNRNKIAAEIDKGIEAKIKSLNGSPVNLESVQLRDIILPPRIKDRIEEVQAKKQEEEKAKLEAKIAVTVAQGKAEARLKEAKGVADALKIEAIGKANANKLISESLSANLLELRQIEVQGKFNDALKTNNNAQIFLTPGGSTPNIWVDTKNPKTVSSALK